MEQGNEGDGIILISLKQIVPSIGADVIALSQISQELLIQIIAKALDLITQGEAQFPEVLPKNVASRHRICTNMATKIKDLGFSGECGYNQLLYPVPAQSRALLTWIVQKMPRNEEERVEEVLGANALLNKRVFESLKAWKEVSWSVQHTASGFPLCNNFKHNSFSTKRASSSIVERPFGLFVPTCIERNSLDKILDNSYGDNLNIDLDLSTELQSSKKASNGISFLNGKMANIVRQSLNSARQQVAADMNASSLNSIGSSKVLESQSSFGNNGVLKDTNQVEQLKQLDMSFGEIIRSIIDEANQVSSPSKSERNGRFAHASEFSQESSVTIGHAGSDVGSSIPLTSSSSLISKDATTSSSEASVPPTSTSAMASLSPQASHSANPKDSLETRLAALRAELEIEHSANRQSMLHKEELLREKELEFLKTEIQSKTSEVETLERQLTGSVSRIRCIESELSTLMAAGDSLEKDILVKKKTLEMLPSATDNISKLQSICSASAAHLMQLAQEWENHRIPLIEKYRSKKLEMSQRREKCKQKVEEMKSVREEMASLLQDLKEKQEKQQVLAAELSKLPKNINRNLYVHRIMDITNSINKQNKEIERITADVRDMQKTINTNTSALQRADAMTEELIYKAANGAGADSMMVDAYRQLRLLRSSFEELIGTVSKIGQLEKQARDLETKIDQELNRVSSNNMDSLQQDFAEVLKENESLVLKIKGLSKVNRS